MDTVHTVNARRWRFLCENWNTKVSGIPFPDWLKTMQSADFLSAVDEAEKTLRARATATQTPRNNRYQPEETV